MRDNRFFVLLVAWTILAVGPGLVVALGVFGPVDLHAGVGGAGIVTWVAGWLAQFGVFFWLMAVARKQNILWWFIASAVPWAADWTMPVNPAFLIVWPVVAVATAVWIANSELSYESLAEHGIRATGVVEQVYQPMMNVVINGVYIKRKLRLRIEPSTGTPYEAFYNGLFMLGEIPGVGDRIPLMVDPSNPQHLQSRDADGDDTAPSPANASAAPAATGVAAGGDLASEIARLVALRDQGALSDAEFAAAKNKLLNG